MYTFYKPFFHGFRLLMGEFRSVVKREDAGRMPMQQRRRFARIFSQLHACYKVVGSDTVHNSLTSNAGGGGVELFTHVQLSPGSVIEVEVKFPARQRHFRFTAEVTWSSKLLIEGRNGHGRLYTTGVRFIDIAPEDQAFIVQFSSLHEQAEVTSTKPQKKELK